MSASSPTPCQAHLGLLFDRYHSCHWDSCLTTIPIATTLTHWFKDKKGLALGISMAGAGTDLFLFGCRLFQDY